MKLHSDIIIQRMISFQKEIEDLKYEGDDIRKYFYDFVQSNLISYSRGYILLEISENFNKTGVIFSEDFGKQIGDILKTSKSEEAKIKFLSHYHRNLIITVWSLYELLTTIICETILDNQVKDELLSHQFNEVVGVINKEKDLGIEQIEKLKLKLKKKHLTHVPINRKYNSLFKLINNYDREEKADKEFLDFLGSLRNTMHANFIYYGDKAKTYQFKEYEFKFEPNKSLGWHDPEPTSPRLYIELIKELVDISSSINKGLNFGDIIPYPDPDSQKIE